MPRAHRTCAQVLAKFRKQGNKQMIALWKGKCASLKGVHKNQKFVRCRTTKGKKGHKVARKAKSYKIKKGAHKGEMRKYPCHRK